MPAPSKVVQVNRDQAKQAIAFLFNNFQSSIAEARYSNLGVAFDLNGTDVNQAFFGAIDATRSMLTDTQILVSKSTLAFQCKCLTPDEQKREEVR